MPTYHYVCAKCDHEFEHFQSMKDAPLKTCPKEKCGQTKWGKGRVKRVLSAGAGLIFKGSGFYITDYRSENYKQAAKKETPASTPSTTGETKTASTGKSESKSPAKKTAE